MRAAMAGAIALATVVLVWRWLIAPLRHRFSIADIANYSWIRSHKWARVPVDGLLHLQRWMETMLANVAELGALGAVDRAHGSSQHGF